MNKWSLMNSLPLSLLSQRLFGSDYAEENAKPRRSKSNEAT